MKHLRVATFLVITTVLFGAASRLSAQAIPTVRNVPGPYERNVYIEYTKLLKGQSSWGGVIGVSSYRWKYIGWDVRGEATVAGSNRSANFLLGGARLTYPIGKLHPYFEPAVGFARAGGINNVFGNGWAYRGGFGANYSYSGRLGFMGEYYHSRVHGKTLNGQSTMTGVRQFAVGVTYSF